MTNEQRIKNLSVPQGRVDVLLDTDAYFKLLSLLDEKIDVFKGSEMYLKNENTPVISPAAQDLAERVKNYSPENPLYVVSIGAITNIASAILLNPEVAKNSVVI